MRFMIIALVAACAADPDPVVECPPATMRNASCPDGFNVNDYSSTGSFTCIHDPGEDPSVYLTCQAPACSGKYELVGRTIWCVTEADPPRSGG